MELTLQYVLGRAVHNCSWRKNSLSDVLVITTACLLSIKYWVNWFTRVFRDNTHHWILCRQILSGDCRIQSQLVWLQGSPSLSAGSLIWCPHGKLHGDNMHWRLALPPTLWASLTSRRWCLHCVAQSGKHPCSVRNAGRQWRRSSAGPASPAI